MKTVIILSGKKSTGKDTSYDYIYKLMLAKENTIVDKKSYADPLKELCSNAFGLTDKQCYGESKERETPSIIRWDDISPEYHSLKKDGAGEHLMAREVLQFVGTNVMRRFYPKIWARAATIAAMRSLHKVVCFTDARFPDEIEEFQKLADRKEIKLIVIRLYRDTGLSDSHRSETALDSWDEGEKFQYGIFNNGTLADLKIMLGNILIKEGLLNA